MAAQWHRLLSAALAAGDVAATPGPDVAPDVVAAAVDGHGEDEAYADEVAAALLQLASVLQQEPSATADDVRRRATVLIRSLRPTTLVRLMRLRDDHSRRREFMLDAVASFEPEAVIRLLLATGRASEFPLSPTLTGLLVKLARQGAEGDEEQLRTHSLAALRDLTEALVQEWWPIDTSAAAYGMDDRYRARSTPSDEGPGAAGPARVVQLSLEIGEAGAPLVTAAHDMLEHGGLRELVSMIQKSPNSDAVATLMEQLGAPARLRQILRDEPVDFEIVDRIAQHLGPAIAPVLLDELAESESRATRRGIFDRLVRLGPVIAPVVADRLKDNRWFVQRNLLALLTELQHWPEELSAGPLLKHSDARVRKEAVKLMLNLPNPSSDAIEVALRDADPQVLRLGLHGMQDNWSQRLAVLLARQLMDESFPRPLRASALRLLRDARGAPVLDILLRHCLGGRSLLGKPKLGEKSPELLAALSVLSAHWSQDKRAAALLAQARKARDPEIRAALTPAGADA